MSLVLAAVAVVAGWLASVRWERACRVRDAAPQAVYAPLVWPLDPGRPDDGSEW